MEPGIWRWIFHLFFQLNVGGASYCRLTFQHVSRAKESRLELCRVVRERFMMGKWLEIAFFRTSVFPIIPVFPRFSRKKHRATFSPESEPTLSTRCLQIMPQSPSASWILENFDGSQEENFSGYAARIPVCAKKIRTFCIDF